MHVFDCRESHAGAWRAIRPDYCGRTDGVIML